MDRRGALLWVLASLGCAVSTHEHDLPAGAAPSVTLKAFAPDAAGEPGLVAGLDCVLVGPGGEGRREATTVARAPLVFDDLAPGQYELRVGGEPLAEPFARRLVVRRGHRVTVRADLARVAEFGADAGAAALDALAQGGTYVLIGVAVVALVAAGALLAEDDDDDDAPSRSHD